jgi:hypothetical protein
MAIAEIQTTISMRQTSLYGLAFRGAIFFGTSIPSEDTHMHKHFINRYLNLSSLHCTIRRCVDALHRLYGCASSLSLLRTRMTDFALIALVGFVTIFSLSYQSSGAPRSWYYTADGGYADSDGDGIVDSQDRCPLVAGSPFCDGCPDSVCSTPSIRSWATNTFTISDPQGWNGYGQPFSTSVYINSSAAATAVGNDTVTVTLDSTIFCCNRWFQASLFSNNGQRILDFSTLPKNGWLNSETKTITVTEFNQLIQSGQFRIAIYGKAEQWDSTVATNVKVTFTYTGMGLPQAGSDGDRDGIPIESDYCPAVYGSSGNGCPIDCNNNSIDDFLDIRDFGATDLNHDNIPDTCQGAIEFVMTSPNLGTPAANTVAQFTFNQLVPSDADVPLIIRATGDLDAVDEFITVKLSGLPDQRIFEYSGGHCTPDTEVIYIPAAKFATFVADGLFNVRLIASPFVKGSDCPDGRLTVELHYLGIGAGGDCNNNNRLDVREIGENGWLDRNDNALLDSCDIQNNPSLDCNSNNALDQYEIQDQPGLDCNANAALDSCDLIAQPDLDCDWNNRIDTCDIQYGASDDNVNNRLDTCEFAKGDFDLNGEIDVADFSILLLFWGEYGNSIYDLDHSGNIDGGDSAIILMNFGEVVWP